MTDEIQSPNKQARRIGGRFILVAVFLDMVGIGIMFPVLPILVGAYTTSAAMQDYWYGVLAVSFGVMQFFCAPLMGALSDRFGRRPVLIAAIVGLGIHYLLIALAPSLWIMLVARLIGGTTGASYSVAYAYLADITAPEDRSKSFGRIGAAFGLGFICGPILGGLLGGIDLHLPFYVAAGFSLVNAIYGFMIVPESLPPERRGPFTLAKANPFAALYGLARHPEVGGLVAVYTLYFLAHMIMIQTWVLFTHFRFGWGAFENGVILFCVGVLSAVVQGLLLGPLVKRLGEVRLALIALSTNVVALTLYGLAPESWMLFVILGGAFLTFTIGPAIQGIVSKSTDPATQGLTMGALQSIASLANVFAPAIGTSLLAAVSTLPPMDWRVGAAFYLCAGLNVVALWLAWRYFGRQAARPSAP